MGKTFELNVDGREISDCAVGVTDDCRNCWG